MLNYITPDFVHVLYKGRIVRPAAAELALQLEAKGYDCRSSTKYGAAAAGRALERRHSHGRRKSQPEITGSEATSSAVNDTEFNADVQRTAPRRA